MRNSFWGSDSLLFNPGRFKNIKKSDVCILWNNQFNDDQGEFPWLTESQLRYNLFTFGFGARKCLGQHDAERAVKALVLHLIDRYDVGLRPGEHKNGDYKTEEGNWVPLANVELELRTCG